MKNKVMKRVRRSIVLIFSAFLCLNMFQGTFITTIKAEGEDEQVSYSHNPYWGGWGNCTWAAWQLVYEATGIELPGLGNAGQWYANAMAAGYTVSTEPRANSVGVWSGHVVYVTDFDGQNIYLKEGGFLGHYNEGWADGYSSRYGEALIGYIYIPGDMSEISAPTWSEQLNSATYISDATTDNGVQRAISEEVKDQDIENLEEEIVKKYDPELVETIKSEEEKAMKDMLQEEQQLTTTETSQQVKSSSKTSSLAAGILAPLLKNKK